MGYRFEDDGSVRLDERTIPVPTTISLEARQALIDSAKRPPTTAGLADRRAEIDATMQTVNAWAAQLYPVTIGEVSIGGVRCHRITPGTPDAPVEPTHNVLINLHAGGFVVGSGALGEAIPIASLTGTTVLAVDYRLAPEHPYPAAVDDVIAVYRVVLEHHAAHEIGIYGTSAGAFLAAQVIVRLREEGLPIPACAGMFSGGGDLTDLGDSASIFHLDGFAGERIHPFDHPANINRAYLQGVEDPRQPLVAPLFADLDGFPPTLLVTSTRDAVLSATALMHRALRRARVPADLIVFEALPHGFWYNLGLPETREALAAMADFFTTHLGAGELAR